MAAPPLAAAATSAAPGAIEDKRAHATIVLPNRRTPAWSVTSTPDRRRRQGGRAARTRDPAPRQRLRRALDHGRARSRRERERSSRRPRTGARGRPRLAHLVTSGQRAQAGGVAARDSDRRSRGLGRESARFDRRKLAVRRSVWPVGTRSRSPGFTDPCGPLLSAVVGAVHAPERMTPALPRLATRVDASASGTRERCPWGLKLGTVRRSCPRCRL